MRILYKDSIRNIYQSDNKNCEKSALSKSKYFTSFSVHMLISTDMQYKENF